MNIDYVECDWYLQKAPNSCESVRVIAYGPGIKDECTDIDIIDSSWLLYLQDTHTLETLHGQSYW